jgi:hypothetical protein
MNLFYGINEVIILISYYGDGFNVTIEMKLDEKHNIIEIKIVE